MMVLVLLLHVLFFITMTDAWHKTDVLNSYTHSTKKCMNIMTSSNEIVVPKLIFGHIFKTGGSSLRAIFREYAQICSYSLMVVVGCKEDNMRKSLDNSSLTCELKDKKRRNSGLKRVSSGKRAGIPVSMLRESDIVIGHLPVGLFHHAYTPGIASTPSPEQSTNEYHMSNPPKEHPHILVTWLRDPFSMIVSAALYIADDDDLSMVEAIDAVMNQIKYKTYTDSKQYSTYVSYLLPGGHVRARTMNDKEEDIRLVKKSLDSYTVIGLLERHTESVKMLGAVLDPSHSLGSKFWEKMSEKEANISPHAHITGAKVVTSASVRAYIRNNATLTAYLNEKLQMEYEIYNYGVKLHDKIRNKTLADTVANS